MQCPLPPPLFSLKLLTMNVTVSEPKKSQVTLTILVDESDLGKYLDQAVAQLSREVKVDGFRPGKVPRNILEDKLGINAIRVYALDLALPQFYAQAILDNNIQAIAHPQVKILSDTPFSFEAVVPILPEVTLVGHDKIKVPEEKVEVKDEDVEELVNYLRRQSAQHVAVDRAAALGDRVELDFEGFDPEGDVPLEGTASKNHPVVLGEGSLIPGFEDEIVGLKAGDEKTFDITFPKNYKSAKFQGKKVKFKVKVNKVEEVKLPEVTTEWIKTLTQKDQTPDELKKEIRTNLTRERESQARQKRENEFFEKLIACATLEIPDVLIEEEIDFILDRTKMDLESQGISWDQYQKYLEEQKRDPRQKKRAQAEKQIKLRLVTQKLFKDEGIEAADEDVAKELKEIVAVYPEKERSKAEEHYKKGGMGHNQLQNKIRMDKLLKKYLA